MKSSLSIVNNKNRWLIKICTRASLRGCGQQIEPDPPRPMVKALLGACYRKSIRRGSGGLSGQVGCAGEKQHFSGQWTCGGPLSHACSEGHPSGKCGEARGKQLYPVVI